MNRLGIIVLLAILGLATPLLLQAQTIEPYSFPTNALLPDGDADGFSDVRTLNSAIGRITSLTVGLNITGEFNGDLYAYLRHTNAATTNFVVLLNRPGKTASNPYGYADSGFGVTFQDGAAKGDIHLYQTNTIPSAGTPLLGTWQPDGRNVDPATVLDTSPRTTTLASFNGAAAAGGWTLFLADMESGATNELTAWSLTIAGQALPTLTWANPSGIVYGTALGSLQLNATATYTYNSTTTPVPGTFTYTNAAGTVLSAGTVLNAGLGQKLSVTFTPTDLTSFLPVTTNVTLNVTPAPLTITAAANSKTYDGTATATVTLGDNRISGDVFTDSYTSASFPGKNAGNGLTVNVSGISISGAAAANYTFNTTASATANITKQALTVTAAANSKAYDGTTGAAALPTITSGSVQTGDTAGFTETYASKTVGQGKTLTLSGSVNDGNSGNNYTYSFVGSVNGVITARALTVTATGVNKPYDGTPAATVTLGDNRISGDVLTDSYSSASFPGKNAGNGLTVSVSGISISGTDAGNYTFNTTASATANITKQALTVTATGVNKPYDGTPAATVTLGDNRISGDLFTDSYSSASFPGKNAGNGLTVSVSGISISGTDAGNYTFNTTASATANITKQALTVTATGVNKPYDGTPAATVTLGDNRISGDVLTDSYTSASFPGKNAGNGLTVSVSGISISGTDAGNYTFNTTASATANITKQALTVTATGVNKPYDGTPAATVTLGDNRISGDLFTDSYTSASFPGKNAGNGLTVSVSGISISGTDAGNYTFNTTASATANITKQALTVTATGVNKPYDGTPAATVTLGDNRIPGDVLTDSYSSASFPGKNAGNGLTVSVSGISISGTDAGNYTFNTTASATANITKQALTVTATGVNKPYDGTPAATVTLGDNRISGDVLTDSYSSASFPNKNAGSGLTVSVSGISISGTDAGNYTFNTTASATANITKQALTVTATGVIKPYDGTPTATVTLGDNRISGDLFTDSYTSASFPGKNAGNGLTVSVSGISISGTDAGNYTLANTTASATANITKQALTVTATGVNRPYDGTPTATVTLGDNRISGDVLTDSYSGASFPGKNAGNGLTVSVSGISISGTDAGNYTFNTTASATANITKQALTVTATGVNKPYDGTPTATVTLGDNRISGDVLTDSYTSASFPGKNAGNGLTVSVSGISISGTDAGNYTFNTTASATANITKQALTVTATGVNKPYDGTATATVTLSDNRISGDVLTDSYTSASFPSKNAGNGLTVSVSGISISGTDAGNYTFNTTASATANITKQALTVTATGVNKPYDGTPTATVTLGDNRISGDVLTDSYTSASFPGKNAGNGLTVSVSGISISGTDAGNYTFNTTASATANITKQALTVTATGVNKPYDGTPTATVTLGDNRISGDVLTDSYTSASFPSKNVGSSLTVNVSGISISGTDAANYTFNTTASATANITKQALTVTATGVNKPYDGTPTATVTLSDNRISGDVLTDSYSSASFPGKNVDSSLTVNVSGISISGTDAGNYTFNTTASATANITKQALTVTATGVNKPYDGTPTATVTLGDNRISGDVLTDSYSSASFPGKNAGNGLTVSVSGISISGTDAGNYTFNTTASATANITKQALTVTATGVNKPYDGTPTATVTLGDNRISGDVLTDSYTSASFPGKNAGNGLTVSVSGISISGTDAGNYTFNTTASATANITARTLTYTANSAIMAYGSAVPVLSGSVTGFVGSDTQGNATTGTLTFTTAATSSSAVGSFAITGSGLTANNGNYTFVQARGNAAALTITQATPTGVISSSPNPAGPGTNVTFTMRFSPVGPGASTPSGNVNFRTNGTIAGSGPLSDGVATFTTSALTNGWNIVVAEYAGDTTFFGLTNSLAPAQLIDTPPGATNFTIQRIPPAEVQVSLATILAHCTPAAGDTITITAVSSTSASNVTIAVAGGWVIYTPPVSFTNADSFTYTVTDNYGLSATGTVTVAIATAQGQILTITGPVNGSYIISGNGIPGYTYYVQHTSDLISWVNIGTVIADSTGALQYTYTPGENQSSGSFRTYYYPYP